MSKVLATTTIVCLLLFSYAFAVMAGYQISQNQKHLRSVDCKVVRVVDGPEDEPVAFDHGQIPRPYTIVSNEPQYKLFVLPGVAGVIDEPVEVVLPE